MSWQLPGLGATGKELATALRQRAHVMELLADLDPTVTVSARESWCELLCAAVVHEALDGMAASIPGWRPELTAMPHPTLSNAEEV